MVRGSQLSQLKYGWIGFKTKIWRAEARQILRRWLTMEHPRRFQTFQMLLFQLKIQRISQVGPWLGRQSIWDSVGSLNSSQQSNRLSTWRWTEPPLIYPTSIQRFEIADIELSLVFSTESNGSKWVEMGWSMYGSYPLQITPLRTLLRSAFKCRMAPKICASFEIRIGPTWSNCQKMSKAWIVF